MIANRRKEEGKLEYIKKIAFLSLNKREMKEKISKVLHNFTIN